MAATPLFGALADRLGRRRAVMAALAALAFAAYLGLWDAAGFAAILALNLAAAVAQSALMPLGDSITLAAVRDDGLDYGRIRVWGSLSFVAAAVGSGLWLSAAPPGGNRILFLVLTATALLVAACLMMPAPAPHAAGPPRLRLLGAFAASRRFWLFVAAASALQASHQLYYGFGTLFWRSLGFSDRVIGGLWAEGVVAEIVLFWLARPLVTRIGPLGLMAASGAAGIVRWSLAAALPGLGAAALLQLLHAFTFGAGHLGAMHFLSRSVPPGAASSAQALYAAASAGLGSGLVMLGAGSLYAAFGGRAYLFMALLSAVGLAGVAGLRRL